MDSRIQNGSRNFNPSAAGAFVTAEAKDGMLGTEETEPSYGNVPSSGTIFGTRAPEVDMEHEISALGNVSSNGDDSGEQRLRVSGVTSIVGILLEVASASCFLIVSETHAAYGDDDEEHVGDLFRSLSLTFLLLGLVAFLLALLPTDRRAVPVGATILVVMIIIWVSIAANFAVNLLLHPYTAEPWLQRLPHWPLEPWGEKPLSHSISLQHPSSLALQGKGDASD
eukprot:s138_g2.t1